MLFNPFFTIKIMDGFFIGNQTASKENEFVNNNKFHLIINCCPKQFKIQSLPHIKVLNFHWINIKGQLIDSIKQSIFQEIFQQIIKTHEEGYGILIVSQRGHSRAITFTLFFLMHKFKWSLYKALQYLNSKKENLQIRANYLKLLIDYEKKHQQSQLNEGQDYWNQQTKNQQQKVLVNTFKNTLKKKNINQINQKFIQFQKLRQTQHFRQKQLIKKVKFHSQIEIINNQEEKHSNSCFDAFMNQDIYYRMNQNEEKIKKPEKKDQVRIRKTQGRNINAISRQQQNTPNSFSLQSEENFNKFQQKNQKQIQIPLVKSQFKTANQSKKIQQCYNFANVKKIIKRKNSLLEKQQTFYTKKQKQKKIFNQKLITQEKEDKEKHNSILGLDQDIFFNKKSKKQDKKNIMVTSLTSKLFSHIPPKRSSSHLKSRQSTPPRLLHKAQIQRSNSEKKQIKRDVSSSLSKRRLRLSENKARSNLSSHQGSHSGNIFNVNINVNINKLKVEVQNKNEKLTENEFIQARSIQKIGKNSNQRIKSFVQDIKTVKQSNIRQNIKDINKNEGDKFQRIRQMIVRSQKQAKSQQKKYKISLNESIPLKDNFF